MPNTKPVGVAYSDPALSGGTVENTIIGYSSPVAGYFASLFSYLGAEAAPASSGSAVGFPLRLGPTSPTSGSRVLDFGVGGSYAWIQSRDKNDYSVGYAININPIAGNVLMGTASGLIGFHGAAGSAQSTFVATQSINALSVSGVVGFTSSTSLSSLVAKVNDILVLLRDHGLMAAA